MINMELIKKLKHYACKNEINDNKKIIDTININKKEGSVGVIEYKYNDVNQYDVYLFFDCKEDCTGPLLLKKYSNELDANSYYNELKRLVIQDDLEKIISFIIN